MRTTRAAVLLVCLALLAPAAAGQLQEAKLPGLSLSIKTDKTRYLQLEPIRVVTLLKNNGASDVALRHKPGDSAAVVEYLQVLEGGGLTKLGEKRHAQLLVACKVGERPEDGTWTVKGGSSHISSYWLLRPFAQGKVTLRATFKPLVGPHKGTACASQGLTVSISKPTGRDAAAYEFMLSEAPIRTGGATSYMHPDYAGLTWTSGSHHCRPIHEHFLKHYGDSTYAYYTRYTMGMYMGFHKASYCFERMKAIVEKAPRDFPLLADSYASLLEHHKSHAELEKMVELARKLKREKLRIVDPRVSERVAALTSYVAWWPPRTPEQNALAKRAAETVRAREFARKHWLPAAMMAVYGKYIQNQYAGFRCRPRYAEISYYDPRQAWGLTIKYLTNEQGGLDQILFHGSLESFRVGRLAGPLSKLKEANRLSAEAALQTFLEAKIADGKLEGRLALPSEKNVTFSMPWGSSAN